MNAKIWTIQETKMNQNEIFKGDMTKNDQIHYLAREKAQRGGLAIGISKEYQPSGAGGTRSPPATPHRLPVAPKWPTGSGKGSNPRL